MINPINYLSPAPASLDDFLDAAPLQQSDPVILKFLQQLSSELLQSPENKPLAELVALGFWLRPANINAMLQRRPTGVVKPLGLVVHFTPANVDTMFIYSWVCAVLMGNKNIVRVATQQSDIKSRLLSQLSALLGQPQFDLLAQRNLFVSYDKDSNVSQRLSLHADARVIWGGDHSVNGIRALATKPRCRDISFADRYSVAVINGDKLTDHNTITTLARNLWRDAQPYGQQACSSPRVIYWVGKRDAIETVFRAINELASQETVSITHKNNHLVYQQLVMSQQMQARVLLNDQITVLEVAKLTPQQLEWHCGDGAFVVLQLDSLESLSMQCDAKLQTLTYCGWQSSELLKVLADPSIAGVDRIVPVGQALDFSTVWDGFELFGQLSRTVMVE